MFYLHGRHTTTTYIREISEAAKALRNKTDPQRRRLEFQPIKKPLPVHKEAAEVTVSSRDAPQDTTARGEGFRLFKGSLSEKFPLFHTSSVEAVLTVGPAAAAREPH